MCLGSTICACMCLHICMCLHVCVCMSVCMYTHACMPAHWNQGWTWHLRNQHTGISRRRTETAGGLFLLADHSHSEEFGNSISSQGNKIRVPSMIVWDHTVSVSRCPHMHQYRGVPLLIQTGFMLCATGREGLLPLWLFWDGAGRTGWWAGVIDPKKQVPKTLLLAVLQSWMIAALVLWKCFINKKCSIFRHCS